MNFAQTRQQFEIRLYLWAKSEFATEIDELFPGLRLFKTGPAWQLCRFMEKLDLGQQRALGRALLRRFHPPAFAAVGDHCAAEDDLLRDRLDEFRRGAFSDVELEISATRRNQAPVRFVSKRKLLKVVLERFQDAFGGRCVESGRVIAGDPSLEFRTSCPGGWIIFTHFWFGRRESLIDYSHAIASETVFEQRGPQGPYSASLVLGAMMSFCSWLGICSQTQWEYLRDDQGVEQACDGVVKLCRHFFGVAPKLLEGLDVDGITPP